MEKCASHWDGIGYVEVKDGDRTYMSSAPKEASYIIKYMHQDKPGEQLVLKFRYEYDIDRFFNYLKDHKEFKGIPASLYKREENKTLYGENIEKIECKALKSKKPIEIVRMKPVFDEELQTETVTVYARRITPEEMLKYIDSDVIKYNELRDDLYKLRKIKGYSERFKEVVDFLEKVVEDAREETDTEADAEADTIELNEAIESDEIWEDIPGVGRWNKATGEIEYNE